ncbi:MAG: hypothetical protein GEV28_32920 [Actinophytocola sp.]|uniref:hypothetical protein n=1 Tax=Actinophytocola sp. TaxID=1872138 RepID=UPI00132734B6|nr:hypothetical protein [Actinophytocola sp.]MPZ84931.1 hypothetical protein [Actinophytocola sp.]
MVSELVRPDLPQNQDLLSYLREHACRPGGPGDHVLGEWQLHTHPDLVERLELVAPDGCPLIPLFGVPVLAADGIVAVAALGTSWLLVKIPELPTGVELAAPLPPLTDQGWHAVNAWQSALPDTEGQRKVSQLLAAALRHVNDIT